MQKFKWITLLLWGVFFFAVSSALPQKRVLAKGGENPYGWDLLSSYTTYFNQKDGGRCENIAIAAALIDGITIQPYGEFSFNATVGRRTEEAGFQQAKIIVNGEYVLGVGGGVCQVSTTLYNAALLAGLTVMEYRAHSLLPAYVPPSRDAMVSTQSDLKIFTARPQAVYLSCMVKNGCVSIRIFGVADGCGYVITERIIGEIPPPEPIVKNGEREEVLREEKSGVKSEAYLECYKNGALIFKKRLRVDEYRPLQGIIVKKVAFTTKKIPLNACVFLRKML